MTSLNKEIDFVLIGGWAVYLYTGLHKSKDIDILVELNELYQLKEKFDLRKNDRLHKYEVSEEGFDIDIYVPFFSELAIPVEELISKHSLMVNGLKTVSVEALTVLKLAAFLDRKNSVKGSKDEIDIVSLLKYGGFNAKKFRELTDSINKPNYFKELNSLIKGFAFSDYTGMKFNEFPKWKKQIIEEMKQS
ncbi:MAG: hypothetical protein ABIA76_01605 [Candidatus Diapherotrites archaeon]